MCNAQMFAAVTCDPEERGLAVAVRVSVLEEVDEVCGVEEEPWFGLRLQRHEARDPRVSVEHERRPFPEFITVLPLEQLHLAARTRKQEVVWSVGRFKGDTRGV